MNNEPISEELQTMQNEVLDWASKVLGTPPQRVLNGNLIYAESELRLLHKTMLDTQQLIGNSFGSGGGVEFSDECWRRAREWNAQDSRGVIALHDACLLPFAANEDADSAKVFMVTLGLAVARGDIPCFDKSTLTPYSKVAEITSIMGGEAAKSAFSGHMYEVMLKLDDLSAWVHEGGYPFAHFFDERKAEKGAGIGGGRPARDIEMGDLARLRHARDPRQKEKGFIRECFDAWQLQPGRYKTTAAFARDMLEKCQHLTSQRKIEDWVREWRRASPSEN